MKRKKIWLPIIIVFSAILVLVGAFGIYFGSYYKAKLPDGVLTSTEQVTVTKKKDYVAFAPKAYETAFIFYQGAKVDELAYAPVLKKIAEGGVLCVLAKMPLNFAIFDVDAGEEILDDFEGVTRWYLGGHSLGGAMASSFASDSEEIDGVILFASYSTKDLKDKEVLSVYGDRDEVLNRKKYEENKENLPADFTEVVIEGGNHANFGYYGKQKGDGEATITREEQIEQTATTVLTFLTK